MTDEDRKLVALLVAALSKLPAALEAADKRDERRTKAMESIAASLRATAPKSRPR